MPLESGNTFGLGPSLGKEAQRREVRKALAEGENVKAKVTVRATDAAGNVATAKRTITLVKWRTDGRTPPLLGVKRRK